MLVVKVGADRVFVAKAIGISGATRAVVMTGSNGWRPAFLQGAYFLATGVWPLLSMRTFEAVTGPKADRWLVRTVGVLVAIIGSSLLLDVRRPSRGTVALGVGSAVGLGTIDVMYATRGRISKVYLIDAIIELSVVAIWLTYLLPKPLRRRVKRSEK